MTSNTCSYGQIINIATVPFQSLKQKCHVDENFVASCTRNCKNIVMLTKFSSLALLEVFKMRKSFTAIDENVTSMTIFEWENPTQLLPRTCRQHDDIWMRKSCTAIDENVASMTESTFSNRQWWHLLLSSAYPVGYEHIAWISTTNPSLLRSIDPIMARRRCHMRPSQGFQSLYRENRVFWDQLCRHCCHRRLSPRHLGDWVDQDAYSCNNSINLTQRTPYGVIKSGHHWFS